MKTIAVLCSGGDAPGMNAAVRSVVRTAIGNNIDVYGIQRGYLGLLENRFKKMEASSVGNIIQHGGTIIQTSRCEEFKTPEGRKKAADILKKHKIDGLVVIGGDGSFNGANLLHKEQRIPVIGIPGTIDNDIEGTDYTIGFDTAVQTAVNAVDKIRDTASSHDRTFIVEVMGRRSPAIALHVGVCSGAENVVFPSEKVDCQKIADDIKRGLARGKMSSIIIVEEGDVPGDISFQIKDELEKKFNLESHVCVLGHIQRGGHPSPMDRFIASKMGHVAVNELLKNHHCHAIIYKQGEVRVCELEKCLNKKTEYLTEYKDLASRLSI